MIIHAFKVILKKMTNQDINISEYKYENNNNHEEDKTFMETNFNEIVNKEEFQNFKEAVELIETTKKQFLEDIMNDQKYKKKYSRDDFFKYYEEKQIKSLENLNYKKKAIEIFKLKDLKGLILLTQIINPDGSYIKIKENKNFEKEMKNFGYDFSKKLTKNEKNYIKRKIEELKEIAQDPYKKYLNKNKKEN